MRPSIHPFLAGGHPEVSPRHPAQGVRGRTIRTDAPREETDVPNPPRPRHPSASRGTVRPLLIGGAERVAGRVGRGRTIETKADETSDDEGWPPPRPG